MGDDCPSPFLRERINPNVIRGARRKSVSQMYYLMAFWNGKRMERFGQSWGEVVVDEELHAANRSSNEMADSTAVRETSKSRATACFDPSAR